jgi:acylphosphatase
MGSGAIAAPLARRARAGENGRMRVRLRLQIAGRVQGVWFRGATQAEARRLGVDGWVRNRPDGGVEVLIEGEPVAVRTLADWCRRGPSGARVTDVEESPEPAADDLVGFEVVH